MVKVWRRAPSGRNVNVGFAILEVGMEGEGEGLGLGGEYLREWVVDIRWMDEIDG